MALESKRITKKEFQTYYEPLRSDFERMVNSVNSSMGFGQIIQKYIGKEVLNTYYHVWDNNLNQQVVLDKTTGAYYPPEQAGPMLWDTSASNGLGFLDGSIDLFGYRKYKYCTSCSDRNTPEFQSVDNFKKRYDQVGSLLSTRNTLDAYLFYDFALTRFNNVFPAVKYDDGINVTFYFKDINGTDKSLNEIAQTTNKPVSEIELSIDEAEIVKPQEGVNTVITSCCDERLSYVIRGQYNIGSILYTQGIPESFCWYVESLTDQDTTVPDRITFTYGGRSCAECVKLNPCLKPCVDIELGYANPDDGQIPSDSCFGKKTTYSFNEITNELYDTCEGQYAKDGYYSDGESIYSWSEQDGWREFGPCSTPSFEGPWVSSIIIPQYTDTFAIPTTTYIGFTGVQDGSPTNAIYAQLQITIDPQISDGTRNIQRDIYKYNVLELVNGQWVQATDKDNRPIGYGDYSLDKGGNRNKLNYRQVYDPSTSQWTMYEGEYVLLYGSTFAYNGDYYSTRRPFTNKFNQRIFKILIYPIWEDDTSYYEIVVNAGDEFEVTPNVISSTSYYQGQPS